MKTKQKRIILVSAVALAGLLTVWAFAMSDDFNPEEPPRFSKQILEEIYRIIALNTQKEPYFERFELAPCESQALFTVPFGKRFVLRAICEDRGISLTVDDNPFIDTLYLNCEAGTENFHIQAA